MNYFDNENRIIERLQRVDSSSVYFPVEKEELVVIFEAIHSEKQWKRWKDSSGKSDPPPDFYCEDLKLMMDVMRVDDHAFINDKGKVDNPTNARESAIQKELKASGILDGFPNIDSVFVNAITDLPTEQDHNYKFYKDNFIRTVEEHKRKIGLYKQNHPGFKTIFFIFDESSAYVEAEQKPKDIYKGMPITGRLHYWFFDKAFLQRFMNSDIDYVIWFTPFKYMKSDCNIVLPKVVFYDTQQKIEEEKDYINDKMVSSEI